MSKRWFIVLLLWTFPVHAEKASKTYDVRYNVKLIPKKDYAQVSINIDDASLLTSFRFRMDWDVYSALKANGEYEIKDDYVFWFPPRRNAKFRYRAKITHERSAGKYDAMMTPEWAIFRGDDLIPAATVKTKGKAESKSYLSFDLPSGWNVVNTGWARDKSIPPKGKQINAPHFIIDNPERRFDRPTGWMIAGDIRTRRAWAGDTRISVSAPKGTLFHRMDVLTYLNLLWPTIEKTLGPGPDKLLIVGGDDPMWRGGLSASNSLYLHADRPLVSENGTSTLLHEVVHMVTRIRGIDPDDWIAEGLAEYYAIEILHRAGGMDDDRREIVLRKLHDWSQDVTKLQGKRSSGAITARAVLLFYELDSELRQKSKGKVTLDNLTRKLIKERKVSHQSLSASCRKLLGRHCDVLAQTIIKGSD